MAYGEFLKDKYPGFSKATSSDWYFNSVLCDLLKENGRAVAIMTNGSTVNTGDIAIRRWFVENRLIECVVSLPAKMFANTNIPTTMVVFSKNNENVRMIDATKICQTGRRQNEFSDEDIDQIMEYAKKDSEFSTSVSLEDLRNNDYCLSFGRFVKYDTGFANGVVFGDIIRSVTRGAPCTASQLDEMVSDEETDMQYLMLANIQDGIIDDELPYLTEIEKR